MAASGKEGGLLLRGAALGIGAALTALIIWQLGWLKTWETKTFDWRVKLWARPVATTDDIVLIMLDQNSLDWGQDVNGLSWPWPRELYSAIVAYCQRAGAKAISLDILFTEPSKYGVTDDEGLGQVMAVYGRINAAVFLGRETGSLLNWPPHVRPPKLQLTGLDSLTGGRKAEVEIGGLTLPKATLPIAEVAQSAAVLSNVHQDPDSDGIYRHLKLFNTFDGKVLPALGLGTYLAAHPINEIRYEPGYLTIGQTVVPIDRNLNATLRFRGPAGTYKRFTAAEVIQSEIRHQMGEPPTIKDPTAFKDKYVLFGFSAPGLFDTRPTPMGGVYTGVEIHATLLDNFLAGDFIRPAPTIITPLLALFLALTSATLITRFNAVLPGIVVSIFALGTPLALSAGIYALGIWLPLVVLELAAGLALIAAVAVNYATEGKQKRFIKNAFQQYLSPAVIEELLLHPDKLKLGGERKTLSIFFSDLQGFTGISEGLTPDALAQLLNDYLSAMTDIIHQQGGTVDKYEGDAIIAFWNAPLDIPDHAVRVVQATLQCQQKLAELRPAYRKRIGKDMLMRIGINTGTAVVGNLGSHTRFDYTMIGDAVNLAARLEGVNKQFGSYTLISQFTRELIGDRFALREMAQVAVVGRAEPVRIFEPMLVEQYDARRELLETFARALALFYEGRFAAARDLFKTIQDDDPPAASYSAKCTELLAQPPRDWDGVWVMTSK